MPESITSAPSSSAHDTSADDPVDTSRRIRLAMLGVMLAMLLGMLDNMIVGTAMPTIVGELGGLSHLSWVVTAYTLATAASTPVWGKLGDLYGRKGTFLTSIVVFLFGSGLSGAAQSMNQLIAFRALQGLGAGGLAVGAFALIGALVSPRERGTYQGMSAVIMAVGTVGGPLLGGFLTGHLGWRWSFYINLPIGLIVLVWLQLMLRLPRIRTKARIDYAGAALLAVTICSLILVTTWGGTQYAWDSAEIVGLAVLTVLALAAFLWSQTRAAEPVLPLRIFRSRNLALSSVLALVVGVAMFGVVSYLPMFQQTVQGASASNSGMLLLPLMLPIVLAAQLVGRVTTKTGKYKIFPVVGTAGIVLGLSLLSTMDTSTSRPTSSLYMAVLGTGLGLVMQIPMTIAQNSVEMKDMGVASASSTMFRTVGGSFGVALFGSLFARQVEHGMRAAHVDGARADSAQLAPSALASLPPTVKDAYLDAVASGTHTLFLCGALICLVGIAAACFIKEIPLRGKPTAAPATPKPTAVQAS
ncbi:MDR family MFS transporter [Streptomyces sp. NPDC059994]|uniref:MDR family MFS transporter n=1 Tax=Streptomyces sp. NPDC059994 TaxID=3347029 RepID=UPI003673D577